MADTYAIVRQFEADLCKYTGAPYAVTTTSCTAALLLAMAWHLKDLHNPKCPRPWAHRPCVEIPRFSYVSVPMSIIHAGGRPTFRDEDWIGAYQLKPYPVWDSARWFSKAMYSGDGALVSGPLPFSHRGHLTGNFVCVSFHWGKTLGIQQGGAILHDDAIADKWLRRARFDGRTEGVHPINDHFDMLGTHCYMAPETAAQGVMRLALLPEHNRPLPNDAYPDLSKIEIFQ